MAFIDFVSYCPKCKMYYMYPKDEKDEDKKQICGYKKCDGKLVHTKILVEEKIYIDNISKDREFLAAMNELRNNDIIAYKERMAKYKKIYEETHKPLLDNKIQSTQQQTCTQVNIPKCPTCGSTNIRKIKAGERTASIIGFGIFSRKANKTWKCENCGHLW